MSEVKSTIMLVSSKWYDSPVINGFKRFEVILVFIASAFFIKSSDSIIAYAVLKILAVFGFLSLFTILIFDILKILFCYFFADK